MVEVKKHKTTFWIINKASERNIQAPSSSSLPVKGNQTTVVLLRYAKNSFTISHDKSIEKPCSGTVNHTRVFVLKRRTFSNPKLIPWLKAWKDLCLHGVLNCNGWAVFPFMFSWEFRFLNGFGSRIFHVENPMHNPKDQAFVRSNVLIKKFMFPFLAKFENFSQKWYA